MRLPNGFGSVTKLSGKRRKPYLARLPATYEKGIEKRKVLGYYATMAEAIEALTAYRKDPTSFANEGITLLEMFERWSKEKENDPMRPISWKTMDGYNQAYKHVQHLSKRIFKSLRVADFQEIVNNKIKENYSYSSLHNIKTLLNQLYTYAITNDLIKTNYAKGIKMPPKPKVSQERFSAEEIEKIFCAAQTDLWTQTVAILLYTGLRVGEMLQLKISDVDRANWTLTGGMKTEAGRNRTIPIHGRIRSYILNWANQSGEYLISENGKKITYDQYRLRYDRALELAGVRNLSPHKCRHTFASLLAEQEASAVVIKEIMGHTDYNFTVNTYTHLSETKLKDALDKLKGT